MENPQSLGAPCSPLAAALPSLLPPEATDGQDGVTSLRRHCAELAERAAARTPGCCAAAVTLTDRSGGLLDAGPEGPAAATHPDVSELVAVQWDSGEGPVPEALSSCEPVVVSDVLRETRWPRYRAASLQRGLRACTTLPYLLDDAVLTVSLWAFRPGGLAGVAAGKAPGLAELAGDALRGDRHGRETAVGAEQFGSVPAGRCARVPSQSRRAGS